MWPGDFLETHCDIDPDEDTLVAVEPHIDSKLDVTPHITTCLKGNLRFINSSCLPVKIKRNQHIAVVSRIKDPLAESTTCLPPRTTKSHAPQVNTSCISINPDAVEDVKPFEQSFRDVHQRFDHVFSPSFPGYNGRAGPLKATVNVSEALPPQRKGRVPQYSRDKLQLLQDHFDELERLGVFRKPEDVGVNVEYVNPSFLVKKSNNAFHLVTSFGEVAKYCKPAPSLMPNVDSTLRLIGQWKYIIKTDLAKAYYQLPLDKHSQRFCGVVTPFRGMRVYQRSAMGMPGSESTLEELMCRLLGDLISDGKVAKIADDLYCCANSVNKLLNTWSQVLQIFSDCDIRLSPSKTVVLPRSTTILGWIWNEGTLSASPHQVSALQQCDLPLTVKACRSFLGAYKALARVIQGCSKFLSPLESLVAGKASADKIDWSDDNIECFNQARDQLRLSRCISIPHEDDQIWIATDGAQTPPGLGATMYLTRSGSPSPLLGGFFSAKLRQHQPRWLPCEIEALSIASAVNHFRPYLIQSSKRGCILTDSKPCVQAHEKMLRGEFSSSSRVQTFLTVVCSANVSLRHISGFSNLVADFASRNAPDCHEKRCQVCAFNEAAENSCVRATSSEDIIDGSMPVPFTSRAAWRDIQSDCPNLSRAKEHIRDGLKVPKKNTKISDIKRYVRLASISSDGLLVVRSQQNFAPMLERIIVPRPMLQGLLTALHIKVNHPTAYQLKKVFVRSYAALDIDKAISENIDACHICASLKKLPKHVSTFSTSSPSAFIGQHLASDVLRRSRQLILLSRESVSSFTTACILRSEDADNLKDGLVRTILPLHSVPRARCGSILLLAFRVFSNPSL